MKESFENGFGELPPLIDLLDGSASDFPVPIEVLVNGLLAALTEGGGGADGESNPADETPAY